MYACRCGTYTTNECLLDPTDKHMGFEVMERFLNTTLIHVVEVQLQPYLCCKYSIHVELWKAPARSRLV